MRALFWGLILATAISLALSTIVLVLRALGD